MQTDNAMNAVISRSTLPESLKRIPLFSNLFHDIVLDQHNQYYIFNRQHDLGAVCKQETKNYSPLNKANLELGRICRSIVNELKSGRSANAAELHAIEVSLNEWRDLFRGGGPFDSYKYAQPIFQKLTELKFPVLEYVKAQEHLTQAFVSIPYPLKAVFQYALVIHDSALDAAFSDMYQFFDRNRSLFYYVKEIKVAKKTYSDTGKEHSGNSRVVKISLVPEVVNSRLNPVNKEIAKGLSNIFKHFNPGVKLDRFALETEDNIFVSQGNLNYKNFLMLLGIIDQVYSRPSNFAFLL